MMCRDTCKALQPLCVQGCVAWLSCLTGCALSERPVTSVRHSMFARAKSHARGERELASDSRGRPVRSLAAAAALMLTIVAAVALTYANGWGPFAPPAARKAPLSIALSTTPHAALLYIAAAKGYFADEGLDVTIKPVSHGKAALDLLAQKKVDLASASEVPFVISVLN